MKDFKYSTGVFKSNSNLDSIFRDIHKRLNDLEDKAFRTAKKSTTTRSQQMLILYHLGILEKLQELKVSNKKKAFLLSYLLNASQDNIEGDLSEVLKPDASIKTSSNYKFIIDLFNNTGLKKQAEDLEKDLLLAQKRENSKK